MTHETHTHTGPEDGRYKEIGIEAARGQLGDLVDDAREVADVILTRRGRPVARLSGVHESPAPKVSVVTLLAFAPGDMIPEDFRADVDVQDQLSQLTGPGCPAHAWASTLDEDDGLAIADGARAVPGWPTLVVETIEVESIPAGHAFWRVDGQRLAIVDDALLAVASAAGHVTVELGDCHSSPSGDGEDVWRAPLSARGAVPGRRDGAWTLAAVLGFADDGQWWVEDPTVVTSPSPGAVRVVCGAGLVEPVRSAVREWLAITRIWGIYPLGSGK